MNNSTINEMITRGKNATLTTHDLSLKKIMTNSLDEKFIVNMNCLFEKYYELLTDYSVKVTLTDEEYRRYKFKPRLLSMDLYGTYDLHYLLLKLNYITSVIYFDFTELRVFRPEIVKLLYEIQVLENDDYIANEMEVIRGMYE